MCIVTRVPCTERLRIWPCKNQIDIQAEEPLVALCVNHTISFQQAENGQRVFIDGHEVTEAIRQPDVTNAVSAVSKHAKVREEMVALQQKNWSSRRSCHGWSRYWYCSFTKGRSKDILGG